MSQNKDYVLGTDNEELKRLWLQHNVWKPYVLESWHYHRSQGHRYWRRVCFRFSS